MKFVGPATAAVLEEAGITPADIEERRVTHAELVTVGVNAGVAARIRREHSLAWSTEGGEDLDRRAKQVRGLQDDEAAWVAASAGSWDDVSLPSDGSAEGTETDTDGEAAWREQSWPTHGDAEFVDREEIAWREASKPKPVTTIAEIDDDVAARLADAGITSIRTLATADPRRVSQSLDIPEGRVRRWRNAARSMDE